jgi:hypothetical protein
MSEAGEILARFAGELGLASDSNRWNQVRQTYAAKTQSLWNGRDWFEDFDTRNHRSIALEHREVTQAGPVFCGIATSAQIRAMMRTLRAYRANPKFWLEWSSHVLPYLESLWVADEPAFMAEVIHDIADRIYRSMDRRTFETAATGDERPGWPGVSCEVWGLNGATGGEGYGWGAVMPAHIIRNVIGFRETHNPHELWLAPNLPEAFVRTGAIYSVRGLHYRGDRLDLHHHVLDAQRVLVEGHWYGNTQTTSIRSADSVRLQRQGRDFAFEARNHSRYLAIY